MSHTTKLLSVLTATSSLLVVLAAPVEAQAKGTLAFSPASGLDSMSLTVVSSDICPATPPSNLQLMVTGSGFPADTNVTPNLSASIYPIDPVSGGYDVPLQESLRDFAAQQTPPAKLSGRYQFSLVCRAALGTKVYAAYSGSLWFVSPTHYNAIAPPTEVAASPRPAAASRVAQATSTPGSATAVHKTATAPVRPSTTPTGMLPGRTAGGSVVRISPAVGRKSGSPTIRPSRSRRAEVTPAQSVVAVATPSASVGRQAPSPLPSQGTPHAVSTHIVAESRRAPSRPASPLAIAGLGLAIGVAVMTGLGLRRRRTQSLPPGPMP
ncbi:MAG: hypothetical protein QOE76_3128 [Frankiales bacterium]|nr:hypothetical protein [Frankiales bacterium]